MAGSSVLGRRPREDALQQKARKKASTSDPLMHYGRHFGRAIYSFCTVKSLISNGLSRVAEDDDIALLSMRERREHNVFLQLLKGCHGLHDRLSDASSAEEIELIADLIQKGSNGSRADDTKGMRGAILDWITPPGENISPFISRKAKCGRGFNHEVTGALLCPTGLDWSDLSVKEKLRTGEMHVRGDHWPCFLYPELAFDPEDPWKGLLRNPLLSTAYKHVFTSPSSVDDNDQPTKAPKSGNARIHGMKSVTKASIAYIATQVRFALSNASTFSQTDALMDSERFYHSIFDLLDDVRFSSEVNDLISWWNKKIFPHTAPNVILAPIEGSALDRIHQKLAERQVENSNSS